MLKYKVDSIDDLDEGSQKLYKQEGNVFILDIDGIDDNVAGLRQQVEQLLTEKKSADTKASEAKAAAEEARKEAEAEKARKSGDIESLEKQYKQQIADLQKNIETLQSQTSEKELSSVALKLSANLADGANQEILSRFIKDRLRYEDGEVKVTDANGNLTISTVDQLAEEFKADAKYAALVTASKANGGGAANQGSSGGGATKDVKRSAFDEMSHGDRMAHFRDGGTITDD